MKYINKNLLLILIAMIFIASFSVVSAADKTGLNNELPATLPVDHELFTFDENGNKVDLPKDGPSLVEEVVPDFSEYEIQNIGGARTFANQEVFLVLDYSDNNKVINNFDNFAAADNYVEEHSDQTRNLGVFSSGMTRSIKHGVVNFKTKDWLNNTKYIEDETGKEGYTNGNYGADAALLGVSKDGKTVKFMMAGVIGWVNRNEVQLVDYDRIKAVSFYTVTNGRLIHKVPRDLNVANYPTGNDIGPAPSQLGEGKVYYSYDGHYFYTNYKTMIDDYKAGKVTNSVNPRDPYYNYYQFLSHRSLSKVTANQLDKYAATFSDKDKGVVSKMEKTGHAFKSNEAKYGVNALLMFGVAMNESARGTSAIAQSKNNLFGHNAYDSSPNSASGYQKVDEGIKYHAANFISDGYLDPCDWRTVGDNGFTSSNCHRGRYNGAHLGDKGSGINVKYASDPYWGEKAASFINIMERDRVIDVDRSANIAIKNSHINLNVRKEPNGGAVLYTTGVSRNYPFVVVGETTGPSVNGNTKWYKVLSDPTLDPTRSRLVQSVYEYNGNKMYGYISAEYVNILGTKVTPPVRPSTPQHPITPEKPSKPQEKPSKPQEKPILKGDVNGDGRINHMDYIMIRNHISGNTILTGRQKEAADFNNDKKVNHMDYIGVRNYIVGRR